MAPIRQQLLEAIDQTSDEQLEATLHFLQSLKHQDGTMPAATAAWNAVLQKLQSLTPEQKAHQRQAVADLLQTWDAEDNAEDQEETWAFLQIALDQDRLSDRPLFP
jgi:uncharacterized damage-inducible protein DinB